MSSHDLSISLRLRAPITDPAGRTLHPPRSHTLSSISRGWPAVITNRLCVSVPVWLRHQKSDEETRQYEVSI
ncbi:hypothetical protein AOLI_G00230580 [Acnodon oligacanthus]